MKILLLLLFLVYQPIFANDKLDEVVTILRQAKHVNPIDALSHVQVAHDKLLALVEKNPSIGNGSGYVILGTLYYRLPGWPISFGDDEKAKYYLLKALIINPTGIDTNFYYGEFMVDQNDHHNAKKHFKKAIAQPCYQKDCNIQQQAKDSLIELDL